MGKKLELIGRKFNRLLVVSSSSERNPQGLVLWNCLCDCGTEKLVSGSALKRGRIKSCGCAQLDAIKQTCKTNRTHCKSNTPEYMVWRSMKKRCILQSHYSYKLYGGRGISICSRWLVFENFLSDMGDRPSKDHSLERVDVNGNYEPSNCVWATAKEQANNRTNNIKIDFEGQSMTLANLAVKVGIHRMTIYWRYRQGWRLPELIKNARTIV